MILTNNKKVCYKLCIVLLNCFFISVGCSTSEPPKNHTEEETLRFPDPIRINQNNISDRKNSDNIDNYQSINEVKSLPDNIIIDVMDKNNGLVIEKSKAIDALADALNFLSKEIPDSLYQKDETITIKVGIGLPNHAVTRLKDNRQRIVELDVLNLYPSQRHYLVHELVHALYQKRSTYDQPEKYLEKWPTYFQYRYEHKNLKNSEIKKKLKEESDINEDDFIKAESFPSKKRYAIYAFPLFSNTQAENKIQLVREVKRLFDAN